MSRRTLVAAHLHESLRRGCHQAFLECERILKKKTNWTFDSNRCEFECGVNFGLGLFEVSISYFPSKLITLLELVGFSADRMSGIDRLMRAAELRDSIR